MSYASSIVVDVGSAPHAMLGGLHWPRAGGFNEFLDLGLSPLW